MNKTMSVFLEVDKLVKVTSSGADPVKIGFEIQRMQTY